MQMIDFAIDIKIKPANYIFKFQFLLVSWKLFFKKKPPSEVIGCSFTSIDVKIY